MKLSRYIAALLMLVTVAGCSSDKLSVKPSPLVNFTPTAKFDVRWQQNVGKAGINVLLPAVTTESVISANGKGEIQCFDLGTGALRWRIDNGFVISGGVGTANGLVLVGGDKGDVAVYEEATGKLRWKSKVSSEVLSAPKLADGVVVVRTENGRITGLDVKDGKRLWLYERSTPALVARGNAGVTVRNGIVYSGFAAGKLTAIGLHNGVIVWESSVSQPRGNTELERISDIISLPIVDDSQVCAVAFQGRLACFDADQGGSMWTRDLSSDKGLTMSRKYLYLTDTTGNVLGLDKLSGSSYWKNDRLAFRKITAPLALDNYLMVADFEGYLHALNRDDGSFVARMSTDNSAIRSAPVLAGDGFVVQTSDGSLYSISIH
jgi:outer membrane protein assembly factor BamB